MLLSALMHSAKQYMQPEFLQRRYQSTRGKGTITTTRIADSPSDGSWQPSISTHRSAAFGAPSNSHYLRATMSGWLKACHTVSRPLIRKDFAPGILPAVTTRSVASGTRITINPQAADIEPALDSDNALLALTLIKLSRLMVL